jgi:imidazoleglycerol-phosphate dehydratase
MMQKGVTDMRKASITRKTRETEITLTLALDGAGAARLDTGIGFFDHMLDAMARFGLMDLSISCKGDLMVDGHHTVEDAGICLGQAIREALGDKQGIRRVGQALFPMDESLAQVAIDICGRSHLTFEADFKAPRCGDYDTQLTLEFFRAVAQQAGMTLHMAILHGQNAHHMTEALYKAFGKALDEAVSIDPRINGVQSTKGALA